MLHYKVSTLIGTCLICAATLQADVVTDWNKTIYDVIRHDGTHETNKANPGWSTRSIAMLNGAIYDAFQAVNREYAPYQFKNHALPNTSLDAAVHQASYELLLHCYPNEQPLLQASYDMRMDPSVIPDGAAKVNGMALGHAIASHYKEWRADDKADESIQYIPSAGLGLWEPDPYWPGMSENPPQPQEAWGPGWRNVATFGIPNTAALVAQLDPIPALDSGDYTAAYNQVRDYGALDSALRSDEDKEVALFWAYDRPSMGPPPALFVRNLWEIAEAVGRSPEENARLFAQASVAMADAAVAAWDAKFQYNFWRPVTAIHQGGAGGAGDTDGNPDTVGDPDWRPLGAPGGSHSNFNDDFTPPFPAWTSGHATMGAALFKSIELFYDENSFAELVGQAPGTTYALTSEEEGSGFSRTYLNFTHDGPLDVDSYLGSPDGENAISRIFLGIHWIFDQQDGVQLGRAIADYVDGSYFLAVPEPSAIVLGVLAVVGSGLCVRRRRA